MKKLFFDIETIPADISNPEVLENLKILHEKKNKKAEEEKQVSFEEFVDKTSFDGGFGRVLCLSLAVNDDEVKCYSSDNDGEWDEKKVLENFWKIAGQCDMFIGHNIRDFDLPFIMQRSIILGVRPTWNKFQELGKKPWEMYKFLDFARYKNLPIFDTMWEWSNWVGGANNKGLEHLALAMGIPSPKDGIDGSEVAKFYAQGEVKKICDYCKRDVETTRAVYKRMIFEN